MKSAELKGISNYKYTHIQRITMCPHGYHHSGSVATPALGTRDVSLNIHINIYIHLIYFCSPDLEKLTKYKTLKLTHLM